jgi:hypothetical protein
MLESTSTYVQEGGEDIHLFDLKVMATSKGKEETKTGVPRRIAGAKTED